MELVTNIYTVKIIKSNPKDNLLNKYPYHVVITICDNEKYDFRFLVEPTEKLIKKCINYALNNYILGG